MCILSFIVLFFFKQKTAYELRISDWSSDVCSSDLLPQLPGAPPLSRIDTLLHQSLAVTRQLQIDTLLRDESRRVDVDPHGAPILRGEFLAMGLSDAQRNTLRALGRSEEHTSELQSLMRTSYAVFCLKKKQNQHLYSLITMPIPINTQH